MNQGNSVKSELFVNALRSLGFDENIGERTVIILHSSECLPYLDAIKVLNDAPHREEIILIVIDQFESRYNTFINHNSIELTAMRDPKGVFIKEGLVPYTPIAVKLSEDSENVLFQEIHTYIGLIKSSDKFF